MVGKGKIYGWVYRITHIETGKPYIGQSVKPIARVAGHISESNSSINPSKVAVISIIASATAVGVFNDEFATISATD